MGLLLEDHLQAIEIHLAHVHRGPEVLGIQVKEYLYVPAPDWTTLRYVLTQGFPKVAICGTLLNTSPLAGSLPSLPDLPVPLHVSPGNTS